MHANSRDAGRWSSSGPGGSHPAGGVRARHLGAGAPAAAVLPLVVVTGLFAWWGWERGAYFGVVFYPGTLVLLGLLAALLLLAPWPALRGPAAIAVGSLLGDRASLTAISALWSPVPAVAIEDALRVFAYATAFVLGVWLCMLLGRRMLLSLLPLAAAGAADRAVDPGRAVDRRQRGRLLRGRRDPSLPTRLPQRRGSVFRDRALANAGARHSPRARLAPARGAVRGRRRWPSNSGSFRRAAALCSPWSSGPRWSSPSTPRGCGWPVCSPWSPLRSPFRCRGCSTSIRREGARHPPRSRHCTTRVS